MKKTIMAIAALAATMAALTARADTWTDPATGITWTYTVSSGNASLGRGWDSPAVPTTTTGALTIPSTINGHFVTSIGERAFSSCSGLTSVTIPNSVTSIGPSAFRNCSGLTNMTIPDSVTSIGDGAFDCSGLTNVTIPDGVTSIGNEAFFYCSGLTSVTIPDSVTSIGYRAFSYCSGLVSFTVGDGNVNYKSVNGLLLSKDDKTLIAGVNGDVMIPDGVTSIDDAAFSDRSGLTSVTIPNSVTNIGYSAFSSCSGLTSVTIPDGVTSIGNEAFRGCSGLKSVKIGNGVMSIGINAFYNCSGLTSVTFLGHPPQGVSDSCLGTYACSFKCPRQLGSEYISLLGRSKFSGFVEDLPLTVVQIISSGIRENDPTVMDVVYKVTSAKPTVKVRALAFEDGERSFAKVVRPEAFVNDSDGNSTAQNIGDAVVANVPHKLSWKVSSEWATRLAKVKFEVLACEGEPLRLELRTIPASDQYGKMKISWNVISDAQFLDAMFWLYADKDSGFKVENGIIKRTSDNFLMSYDGCAISTFSRNSRQYVNGVRNYYDFASVPEYVFAKMGYSLLSGDTLTYANQETRLGLSPSGARQYAYKMVEE